MLAEESLEMAVRGTIAAQESEDFDTRSGAPELQEHAHEMRAAFAEIMASSRAVDRSLKI